MLGLIGELNKFYLEFCGILVCFVDKEVIFEYWLLFIVIVLLMGNLVVLVVFEIFYEEVVEI